MKLFDVTEFAKHVSAAWAHVVHDVFLIVSKTI